ncbi:MAG: hypothetical protein GY847_09795 [Proteobacteria bacterium]|nr:hypothetical protein [Pseudomonadota bacterium]
MIIEKALINSLYSQKTTSGLKGIHSKKTSAANLNKTADAESANASDKIDLKGGMSLERIQSLLTTEIGKKIDESLASAGIDITAAAGIDWSPEATAGRIFDFTTGLIDVWRRQHPKMSEEEVINSFEKVIRGSVDRGASEAMGILKSAGIENDATSVAEKTMSVLHKNYDDYFANLKAEVEEETPTSN